MFIRLQIQDRHLADIEIKTKMQKMHEDFQAEISRMKAEESKLKNELLDLADIRKELDTKLQQRQQLVIELQSQLSMLGCELDEFRADEESRRIMSEIIGEKENIIHELKEKLTIVESERDELWCIRDSESREIAELSIELQTEKAERKSFEEKLSKIQCLYSDVSSTQATHASCPCYPYRLFQ